MRSRGAGAAACDVTWSTKIIRSANLDEELGDVAACNVQAAREVRQGVAVEHGHNVGDTITRVKHNARHETWPNGGAVAEGVLHANGSESA